MARDIDTPRDSVSTAELRERFTEHLAECQAYLFGNVFAMVQNVADAEDICQRASVILWGKFDQYVEGTNFRAWALKIAQYEAMNFVRRRRRDRLFLCEQALEALIEQQTRDERTEASNEGITTRLNHCLDKLPQHQRQLIKLYYEGSGTISQIAKALSRSENAVRVAMHRTRLVLRDCVDSSRAEEAK